MSKKVLVIDSGVGGLTSLACMHKMLPRVDFLFYADDEFLPYGEKTEAQLARHICDIISTFEDEICAVVLACNTATSVAVDLLRKIFCFPIIGTEPAIIPACRSNGKVCALTTTLTAKQPKFLKLTQGKDVIVLPQAELAKVIDDYLLAGNRALNLNNCYEVCKILNGIKTKLKSLNVTKLVLGCTHYIYLKYCALLESFTLFDGNFGVAKRLCVVNPEEGTGKVTIVFASGNKKKTQIALCLFKELMLFDF